MNITIPNRDLSTEALKSKLASLKSRMDSETELLTNAYTTAWREKVAVEQELNWRERHPDVVEK